MRPFSRDFRVGFLLLLLVAVGGCQPLQPALDLLTVATPEAVATVEDVVESEAITGTAPLSPASDMPTDNIAGSTPISKSVAITVGWTANEPQAPVTSDPALLEAGLAIYRAQYCGVCHTLGAAETRGTFGPPHNGMGAISVERLADTTYSGAATTPAEYIRESIVEPQVFIVPGYATTSHRMPTYAHLDAAALDALVAFLLAQ